MDQRHLSFCLSLHDLVNGVLLFFLLLLEFLRALQAKLDEKNEQKVAIENEIKAMSTYLRERQRADVMDDIDKEFTDALQAYDSKVEEVKKEHANIVKRLNEMREWADRFTISVEGVSTPSLTLHAWGKSLEFDVWLPKPAFGFDIF